MSAADGALGEYFMTVSINFIFLYSTSRHYYYFYLHFIVEEGEITIASHCAFYCLFYSLF